MKKRISLSSVMLAAFMLAGMFTACTPDSTPAPADSGSPAPPGESPSPPPDAGGNEDRTPMQFASPFIIVDGIADNPIQGGGLQNIPDPKLIYHEGYYYVYSTDNSGGIVSRSADLITFEHMGYCITPPEDVSPPHYMYWDPTPFYHEETKTFYLYYSTAYRGGTFDVSFDQRMKYATADNPLGPFEFQGYIELDWDDRLLDVWAPLHKWAIAPSMWEREGKFFFFFTYKGWAEGVEAHTPIVRRPDSYFGTMIFMQEFSDPATPIPGTRRPVVWPTMLEELNDTSGVFDVGIWEYTLEGPTYFEYDGTAYLMYSGNSWESPYYFIGYATWDMQGSLSDAVFHKYPDDDTYMPLLGNDVNAVGMGNNSICITPDGRILMAYHGYPADYSDLPYPDSRNRRLYITELTAEDGKLVAHRPYDIPVSYHLNGGEGEGPDPFSMAAGSVFTAADITGVEAPEGMTFKEWNTRSNGTGRVYAPGEAVAVPASKFILYAIWEPEQP